MNVKELKSQIDAIQKQIDTHIQNTTMGQSAVDHLEDANSALEEAKGSLGAFARMVEEFDPEEDRRGAYADHLYERGRA